MASLISWVVMNLPTLQENWVQFMGWEDPLENGMATHSRILVWSIPWTEEAWQATVHGVARSWIWLSNYHTHPLTCGFPGGSAVKEICLQCRRPGFDPCVGKILWRRKWQSTPVFFPGKSHGQRRLVAYNPWDLKRVGHDGVTKQQQSNLPSLPPLLKHLITVLQEKIATYSYIHTWNLHQF